MPRRPYPLVALIALILGAALLGGTQLACPSDWPVDDDSADDDSAG